MKEYPKVYLVLDNCFAIKRWVDPDEWFKVIDDIGFKYVEASTDNEIDMFYAPDSYVDRWFDKVEKNEKKYGIKVANFYTGYQTYRTSGLGHPDNEYVRSLIDNWFKKLIDRISEKDIGLGFSYHAITEDNLNDRNKFFEIEDKVKGHLTEIAEYAAEKGNSQISIEAMYSPHQPPWTFKNTERYLDYHKNLNVTLDVGHMKGQTKFLFPTKELVEKNIQAKTPVNQVKDFVIPWALLDKWTDVIELDKVNENDIKGLYNKFKEYDYLYSHSIEEADPYVWLEKYSRYSPIIHLQQTDGITAVHEPFTDKYNSSGIIHPREVLEAIKKSYDSDVNFESNVSGDIYLTFEIFFSSTATNLEIVNDLKETLNYWRKIVPEDGLKLDELLDM